MSSLIKTLKSRTTHLVQKTRDRGIDVLGKVQHGTLDWHRTLETRRAELDANNGPRWFQLGGLQIFVIDRFDRALSAFGEKVREEIQRLQHLELKNEASTAEVVSNETQKATPKKAAAKKAAPKKAAPKKAAKKPRAAKKPAAKRAATKKPIVAKATPTKTAAKAVAKSPNKTAKKAKARPAAKRPGGTKATRRFIMPIASYDELTAKEVLAEVHRLTPAQCETVRSHELSHKKRKTVVAALDAQLA